jgi:hypothetical protein
MYIWKRNTHYAFMIFFFYRGRETYLNAFMIFFYKRRETHLHAFMLFFYTCGHVASASHFSTSHAYIVWSLIL